ncbi:potassium-transporting ATPase subunit KdpC [Idiomarina loihiensis]|uniref:potassium-transporting ATPase subunit KdpC n=1 Tax=Idiomarina loihiensis TaxID=135577 RepID=UPI0031589942
MNHNHSMTKSLWVGLRFSLTLIVVCGVIFTSVVTLVGEQLFPNQATGSVIMRDGKPIGSELVAQDFTSERYFYARPSAAGYDPTATGGSNLAPSNPELRAQARERSERIQKFEGVSADEIPVELIAATGAGLDPHISPAAAEFQAPRIAKARGLSKDEVMQLVREHTEGKQFGVFGQPRVNVLMLNLALDNVSTYQDEKM